MVVVPPAMPVTVPSVPTVATVTDVELHTPPLPVVLRVSVAPGQTGDMPVSEPASGNAFTDTVFVVVFTHPFAFVPVTV